MFVELDSKTNTSISQLFKLTIQRELQVCATLLVFGPTDSLQFLETLSKDPF